MAQRFKEPGTLLRGPDGSLYFISDKALSAHKLDSGVAQGVNRARVFDRIAFGKAGSPREVGLSSIEDNVRVAIVDLAAVRRSRRKKGT